MDVGSRLPGFPGPESAENSVGSLYFSLCQHSSFASVYATNGVLQHRSMLFPQVIIARSLPEVRRGLKYILQQCIVLISAAAGPHITYSTATRSLLLFLYRFGRNLVLILAQSASISLYYRLNCCVGPLIGRVEVASALFPVV